MFSNLVMVISGYVRRNQRRNTDPFERGVTVFHTSRERVFWSEANRG